MGSISDSWDKAELWSPLENHKVQCHLCAHTCTLRPGARGRCAVRVNDHGELKTLVGNKVISLAVDPIEKKPLYHYLPGSKIFSIGSMGCNFSCTFCQNSSISRYPAEKGEVQGKTCTPQFICDAAVEYSCQSIAFTYNEPTVFYEFMLATADKAKKMGLGTVLVSNGFQSKEALDGLKTRIHAANIDLKSYSDDFYRSRCGGRLAPVLDNLKRMRDMGWWIEVTTLFIPGLNDSAKEMHDIARFIKTELGADVPWHCSAFHPSYQMQDRPPTPPDTLLRAVTAGESEGLSFIYPGNSPFSRSTACPSCGTICVERQGWNLARHPDFIDSCPECGFKIPGIWASQQLFTPQQATALEKSPESE